MERIFIAHTSERVDGAPGEEALLPFEARPGAKGLRVEVLTLSPLSEGWDTPLPKNHCRSGASPIEALRRGVILLCAGRADAVAIRGREPLRTGYTREERHRLMAILPGHTIPEAYNLLAERFAAQRGIPLADFEAVSRALFENYLRTFRALWPGRDDLLPGPKWYEKVTPLFRGVDCANPLIDYEGEVVLAGERGLAALGLKRGKAVEVLGVGFAEASGDGPDHVAEIARFDHLSKALREVEQESGQEIAALAREEDFLLEAYTCYPVIPMAFLLASGMAKSFGEIPDLLEHRPVTVTGGMNLARAPWDLPALRALIAVARAIASGAGRMGLVHGNGGIGYRQGAALLGRAEG